jgi:putative FmdB family regulatory protein
MPLFDYLCIDCGKLSEILISGSANQPKCDYCGSQNLKKQIAAPSSLSGEAKKSIPGMGDTTCCGSTPGHAGCAGPGSCCGNT